MRPSILHMVITLVAVLFSAPACRASNSSSDIGNKLPLFREINDKSEYYSLPDNASLDDTLKALHLERFELHQSNGLGYAVLLVEISDTRRAKWEDLPERNIQPERRSLRRIVDSLGSVITVEVLEVMGTCGLRIKDEQMDIITFYPSMSHHFYSAGEDMNVCYPGATALVAIQEMSSGGSIKTWSVLIIDDIYDNEQAYPSITPDMRDQAKILYMQSFSRSECGDE